MAIEETTTGIKSRVARSSGALVRRAAARTGPRPAVGDGPHRCLLDVLRMLGEFETFLRLAEAAQVTEDLAARSPLTVLAPTDAAFAAHDVDRLLAPESAEMLCDYVERHLVRGPTVLDQALEMGALVTIDGARVPVCEREGTVWLEDARLDRAPLVARNGVVFVLDRPLAIHALDPIAIGSTPTLLAPSALVGGDPQTPAGGALVGGDPQTPAGGALEGARAAFMSLAPSRLQTAPLAEGLPELPRATAPVDGLDHGRTALLSLPPSKLRPIAAALDPRGYHDGVRSG